MPSLTQINKDIVNNNKQLNKVIWFQSQKIEMISASIKIFAQPPKDKIHLMMSS